MVPGICFAELMRTRASSRQYALSWHAHPPSSYRTFSLGWFRRTSASVHTSLSTDAQGPKVPRKLTSGVRSPQIQISVPHFPRAMWRQQFNILPFFHFFFIPSDDVSVNSTSNSRSTAMRPARSLVHSSKPCSFLVP
jgi:hypothetical protein